MSFPQVFIFAKFQLYTLITVLLCLFNLLQVNEESTRFLREEGKQVLTFKIPLSHSGAAGLGISVKGKMDGDMPQDTGIFVKSVIAGGAAQKVNILGK